MALSSESFRTALSPEWGSFYVYSVLWFSPLVVVIVSVCQIWFYLLCVISKFLNLSGLPIHWWLPIFPNVVKMVFLFFSLPLLRFLLGLPWWLSGEEPACQWRRCGFDPWSGRIPHVVEQLSLCTTTLEPGSCNYWSWCPLEPVSHCKRSHCNEKPKHCN